MIPALDALASAQLGAFTARQAIAIGLTPNEIRAAVDRRLWTRLTRGGYVVTEQWDRWGRSQRDKARIAAVTLAACDRAVASHFSAAALWGAPVLHHGGQVHVTSPTWLRRSPARIVHRANLSAAEVTHRGAPVTTPLRTALDVGRLGDFRCAVVTVDGLLAAGLLSHDLLRQRVGEGSLGQGAAAIRRVVAFASPLSESAGESVSRVAIAAAGLPAPRLQVEITGRRGTYRGDFLWGGGLIGEFDGRTKYDDRDALYAEKRREDDLRAMGFTVIRWGWDEAYRDFAPVAARIRSALRRAA